MQEARHDRRDSRCQGAESQADGGKNPGEFPRIERSLLRRCRTDRDRVASDRLFESFLQGILFDAGLTRRSELLNGITDRPRRLLVG